MKNVVRRLWKEEEGQSLVEYGLLIALIALVGAATLPTVGTNVSSIISKIGTCLGTNTSC